MKPYQWAPLTAEREIRLLCVKSDNEVTYSIVNVTLDSRPIYVALSYTWGSQTFTEDMPIGDSILKISPVAKEFLQNISKSQDEDVSEQKTKFVWIDAICIDQTNNTEKSAQVNMIGDIFSGAEEVIIWLGAQHEAALRYCEEFREYVVPLYEKHRVDEVARVIEKSPYGVYYFDDDWAAVVNKLANDRYFSRTWVVQEIILARQATVTAGQVAIPWTHLHNSLELLRHYSASAAVRLESAASFSLIGELKHSYFDSTLTFVTALHLTSHCECSDPRDQIFALLGLSQLKGIGSFLPDYSSSAATAFHHATCALLSHEEFPLRAISSVSSRSRIPGLPTWVPDWHTKPSVNPVYLRTRHGDKQSAGGTTKPHVGISDDHRLLTVSGRFVDTIADSVPLPSLFWATPAEADDKISEARKARIHRSRTKALREWIEACSRLAPRVDSDESSQIYSQDLWRTFMCNRNDEFRIPPDDDAVCFESYVQIHTQNFGYSSLKGTLTDEAIVEKLSDRVSQSDRFKHTMTPLQIYRKFAVTAQSRCALVPEAAVEGDKVCVFRGGETPFVLRPKGNEYEVLGDCYVHGIMDGEAMQGQEGNEGFEDIRMI